MPSVAAKDFPFFSLFSFSPLLNGPDFTSAPEPAHHYLEPLLVSAQNESLLPLVWSCQSFLKQHWLTFNWLCTGLVIGLDVLTSALIPHVTTLHVCISTLKHICWLPEQLPPQIRWFHMKIPPNHEWKMRLEFENEGTNVAVVEIWEKEGMHQLVWTVCAVSFNLVVDLCWPTFSVGLPRRTWLCLQGCFSPSGLFKQHTHTKKAFPKQSHMLHWVLSFSIIQKHPSGRRELDNKSYSMRI